jgi:hypothetical protein
LNTNSSAQKPGSMDKKGGETVEKVRRARKGTAAPDAPQGRFYVGTMKDGLPVMTREVTEDEALLDCVMTGRPFLMVELYTSVRQPVEGGGIMFTKVTATVDKIAAPAPRDKTTAPATSDKTTVLA